ncbi:MAG TPA: hypothetical protein V6D16_06705 [Candidatus Obscuribacterales bacterium]
MDFHKHIINMISDVLNKDGVKDEVKLYHALRIVSKYRSQLIANTLIVQNGLSVRSGPFAGMKMPRQVSEGCFVPKILGSYEQELHAIIQRCASTAYDDVINIGCAEGYYAIGLALLMPQTNIWAYDINSAAQDACRNLAAENGVSNRVFIGGHFKGEDFQNFEQNKVLVVCDIEGAELNLLEPAKFPSLRNFDILVELHDVFNATTSEQLLHRFVSSHNIEKIEMGVRNLGNFPELAKFEHLDQLLAVWEWRSGPTPWAFLTSKELIKSY